MTRNRRSKRAIRSRMEETGEKYTEARRALLDSGGTSGSADDGPSRHAGFLWPEDSLGWFTDQAYNAILLAIDEARMLSHASVEPEHLLLALTRRGNVRSLLPALDHAVYEAILRTRGFGPKLELRPRRSPASEEVLRRAVGAAAARGILGPSTEHLLLALGEEELPRKILTELGIPDVQALVDSRYPTLPRIGEVLLRQRAAQLAARGRTPPSPGPMPPIFERFSAHSRAAIDSGTNHARRLNDPEVEPVHLLLGVLDAEDGVAATVRSHGGWQVQASAFVQPHYPESNRKLWTDIFSSDARRIVAEDVLVIAERLGYRTLTTGHLLLAVLDSPDERTSEITRSLAKPKEVAAAVKNALADAEET